MSCPGGKCLIQRDGIKPVYWLPRWFIRKLPRRVRRFVHWNPKWGFPLEGYPMPLRKPVRSL